jgi:hypothetical protein
MASKKQSKFYVQRLFEDEYVQDQLREAASGIRSVYGRVRKQPAEDETLYGRIQQAATSMREAITSLWRPEPEPTHRVRTALIAAVAVVGGSVLIISKRGSMGEAATGNDAGAADALQSDGAPEQPPESQTAPSTTSESAPSTTSE